MGKVTGNENGQVGWGPMGVDPESPSKVLDFILQTVNKEVYDGSYFRESILVVVGKVGG